jgi:hypothetical protein
MGRGRAKAKQQKVARELKYNTHFTDLDALQRELGAGQGGSASRDVKSDDWVEESDEYEDWPAPER